MIMAATTLTDRALVRLSGGDVRGFLNGLVTNEVAGPLPVWAALLTPQGKCLFDFIVWDEGDDLLLDCEGDAAEDLIRRLTLYRLRRPIKIERDEGLAVHWEPNGAGDPRLPALGRRWLAPESVPASGWREHRLRLGVCEGRAELGDLLWLECNAAELNGVSFAKGCYVGQENTARMNWRQKVNRRLIVVEGRGGNRTRAEYPELGLSVVHARVDAVPDNAIVPGWLSDALAAPQDADRSYDADQEP
jgi:folate-binding protein YgfZ